jgi:hypothetical protein
VCFSSTLNYQIVSRMSREQFNELRVPGVNEFRTIDFLTIETYMICYLFILRVNDHWDSGRAKRYY